MTSLDRLKDLMAATALLAVLTACASGADTAQAANQEPAVQDHAAGKLALSFEELPEGERDARQALGEQIVRLTSPPEFLSAIDENIVQAVQLTVPMNHADIDEDEQSLIDTLTAEYAAQYEPLVIPRLGGFYASLFTVEEMEELVAFLTSETGGKYRALANELNEGIGEVLHIIVSSVANDVMREVRPESFGMEPRQRAEPAGETIVDPSPATEAPEKAPDGTTDPE